MTPTMEIAFLAVGLLFTIVLGFVFIPIIAKAMKEPKD